MPDNSKESVLITGANGFVGSRLSRRLISDGFHVTAGIREGCDMSLIDDLRLDCRYGDITRPETLPEMVADIDYIVHNAGLVKARRKEQFYEVNQIGTRNLLRAALDVRKLKKFIYVSSVAAAGPSENGVPITEDMAVNPITEYGRSKVAGEKEILALADRIPVAILRPPAVYGPGDREAFTFFQILDNRLKPYIGNLNRRIQMVHVDDLCLGISRAIRSGTESGVIYFIAESRAYTYRDLIRHIRQATGKAAVPFYIPAWGVRLVALVSEKLLRAVGKSPMFTVEKANEILNNWEVSTARAEHDLNFHSQISFPQGAQGTYYWYREEGWL
ncbi:conserved hypothetical protein [Candidatus Zixiibacteriota bacterium]|nr:conserved hypothetical protein [candidate division Zixibacteria bacterium]